MTETCETCRFGVAVVFTNPTDLHPSYVQCRRRSPLVTGGMMSTVETVWPKTALGDWCGEHKPKETPNDRPD